MLDAEPVERTADLGETVLVDRFTGLGREEVMAAAIGIETARQPFAGEHISQRRKGRGGAFLLDQKRRIGRARRIIHGHDQVEFTLTFEPGEAAAVLVQHHAFARLALALASVRPAPLRSLHQPRRMQLRLHPGVAPAEVMVAHQMLVKMLHVPAPVTIPV